MAREARSAGTSILAAPNKDSAAEAPLAIGLKLFEDETDLSQDRLT